MTADKGRTIVAIYDTSYMEKVREFLNNNQFSTITKHPTDKYQKYLQQILRQRDKIINKQNNPMFQLLNNLRLRHNHMTWELRS